METRYGDMDSMMNANWKEIKKIVHNDNVKMYNHCQRDNNLYKRAAAKQWAFGVSL